MEHILTLPDLGLVVPYQPAEKGRSLIRIEAKNVSDQDEIDGKLRQSLLARFWFLNPSIKSENIIGKYRVALDEKAEVEIYSFYEGFDSVKLGFVASTLAKYYHSLKDKSIWNLESIQVRAENAVNVKSGKLFRGNEFPDQRRFELYPASFGESDWGPAANCVQASTAHETTHVVLEPVLHDVWNKHIKELGWEFLKGEQVILPGGAHSNWYNRDYQNLPSEYASYALDDDRAETVVAYLFDHTKLNEIRRSIMNKFFHSLSTEAPVHITQELPGFPNLPTITVNVSVSKIDPPKFKGITKTGKPDLFIPLEEYRKLR